MGLTCNAHCNNFQYVAVPNIVDSKYAKDFLCLGIFGFSGLYFFKPNVEL